MIKQCCAMTIREYESLVWPIEGPTNVTCTCDITWTYDHALQAWVQRRNTS